MIVKILRGKKGEEVKFDNEVIIFLSMR